ncbi:hypothetical protein CDAR_54511 [Caerostris darwini]|uniref:Uncharacterized protein n=1 Tax=Caerostris darwini TaxID=1538125 RepID=A0AAV4T072_9ARAC|nr:hypothetical protein CDAR_54511 [Caerostris darwini]
MQIQAVVAEDNWMRLPSPRMIERSVETFEEKGRTECLFLVDSGCVLWCIETSQVKPFHGSRDECATQIETVVADDDGMGLPSPRMIERSVETFEEKEKKGMFLSRGWRMDFVAVTISEFVQQRLKATLKTEQWKKAMETICHQCYFSGERKEKWS